MSLRLEWVKEATDDLGVLLASDPAAAQQIIALALALAEHPDGHERTATRTPDVYSTRSGQVTVVYQLDIPHDWIRILAFGTTV